MIHISYATCFGLLLFFGALFVVLIIRARINALKRDTTSRTEYEHTRENFPFKNYD